MRLLKLTRPAGQALLCACLCVLTYLAAPLTLRTEKSLDFTTGALRLRVSFGPILLRDEQLPETIFEALPVSDDGSDEIRAIRRSPEWHPVSVFWGYSHHCPQYAAVSVLGDETKLGHLSFLMPTNDVRETKRMFLAAVAEGNLLEAHRLVKTVEERVTTLQGH